MKLNIGSGYVKGSKILTEEWTNVDFSYTEGNEDWTIANYLKFDLTNPWPIDSNSIDAIFASHIFEHFDYFKLHTVLQEVNRVLKPGAPIRIICPDARVFVRNWQIKNKEFVLGCYGQQNWDTWGYANCPNIAYTDMFYHDHYDHSCCPSLDFIMLSMIKIGFTKVEEMSCGNTLFPEYFMENKETRELGVFGNRPIMSYYLEGVK